MRDNTHPEISMRIVNLRETVRGARAPRAESEVKVRRPMREAQPRAKTSKSLKMTIPKVKTSYLSLHHLQSKQIKMVASCSKRRGLR